MKNHFNKAISAGLGLMIASATALIVGFTGNASALSCAYQYNANGFTTSTTPVFNSICGISGTTATTNGELSSTQGSYPLGDEPNFVRIRQNTSGSPLGSNNPELSDSLTSSCTAGEKFDIWTYIHNNAESQYNDNGSGSAVANNVALTTSAPVNTTGNDFTFTSTVSASNAASASDSASLDCAGQPVELTLSTVPYTGSSSDVAYNNNLNQTTYGSLPNSVVNGSTPIGSPGPMSSGTEWGCWNYRVVVVYQVTVTPIPVVTPPSYMCTDLGLTAENNRTVKISNFATTAANGASFTNAVIYWGDHTKTTSSSPIGLTHQYAADNTYNVTAVAYFDVNGHPESVTSANCEQPVTFTTTGGTTPQTPPATTTAVTTTTPTALVNTGPGSVAGLFAAASIGGTVFYRRLLARRLSRQ